MLRSVALLGLLATGCQQLFGLEGPTVAPDATVNSSDATDGALTDGTCESFSTQLDTCTVVPTSGLADLVLTGINTYDTSTHVLTTSSGTQAVMRATISGESAEIDVLLVRSFTLDTLAVLDVTGSSAFGIVATDHVSIAGLVDLRGATAPAARTSCKGINGNGGANGAGGGGGGGFQGTGGDGGYGENGVNPGGAGSPAMARPAGLVGGCAGGNGGSAGGNAGNGGNGGGAILIAAGTQIMISGVINSGGLGGKGGNAPNNGGGGGGSGGMILLESPSVSIAGIIAANGGGAGEGGGGTSGNGRDGADGYSTANRAAGGVTASAGAGGNGGDGGAGTGLAGLDGNDVGDGGGGGGGGVGYIAIHCPAPDVSGLSSPAFAAWP